MSVWGISTSLNNKNKLDWSVVGFPLKIYSFEFRRNCCCYNLFCKHNYLQTLSKYIKYKYLSRQRLNNYPRWWKLSNPLDRFLVAGVSHRLFVRYSARSPWRWSSWADTAPAGRTTSSCTPCTAPPSSPRGSAAPEPPRRERWHGHRPPSHRRLAPGCVYCRRHRRGAKPVREAKS